jgi:hypothetical protein
MRKYQGVISLIIFLLIVFLAGFYAIKTYGNNEKLKLEINYVSDHSIAEVNSKIPNEISVFFDKFELSEIRTEYENKIFFRRIDLKDFKSVSVSNDETSSLPKMYFKKDNDILDLYKNDTLNIVYYYLVSSNNVKNVDNIKIFNDVSLLREHIKTKLNDKSLFKHGKVLNKITILLLTGEIENSTVSQTPNEPQEVIQNETGTNKPVYIVEKPIQSTQVTQKTIKIAEVETVDSELDVKGNTISWSKKIENVTLILTPNEGEKFTKQLIGESKFTFNPKDELQSNNKPFPAGFYDVSLKVNDNKIKVIGQLSTNNKKRFLCSE